MDAPGDKAHDGQMLDHKLFLFGGEQIGGPGPHGYSGHKGRRFFLCTLRSDMVDRADFLRRCSIPPRTSLTLSCLLHIHHPTCVRELEPKIVEELSRAAEVLRSSGERHRLFRYVASMLMNESF